MDLKKIKDGADETKLNDGSVMKMVPNFHDESYEFTLSKNGELLGKFALYHNYTFEGISKPKWSSDLVVAEATSKVSKICQELTENGEYKKPQGQFKQDFIELYNQRIDDSKHPYVGASFTVDGTTHTVTGVESYRGFDVLTVVGGKEFNLKVLDSRGVKLVFPKKERIARSKVEIPRVKRITPNQFEAVCSAQLKLSGKILDSAFELLKKDEVRAFLIHEYFTGEKNVTNEDLKEQLICNLECLG